MKQTKRERKIKKIIRRYMWRKERKIKRRKRGEAGLRRMRREMKSWNEEMDGKRKM